jgi:hypothetical protein
MRTPGLSRFHGFLLASGALIGLVVVVSGLAVGRFFEHTARSQADVIKTAHR